MSELFDNVPEDSLEACELARQFVHHVMLAIQCRQLLFHFLPEQLIQIGHIVLVLSNYRLIRSRNI
jgi:hypothetical protein